MKKFLLYSLLLTILSISSATAEDILIPRSMPGDKGAYYIVEQSRSGDIVRALSKRIGIKYIDYSLVEINCSTMTMRGLGEKEGEAPKEEKPTDWFKLMPGSSKSDLANFVCK